MMLMASQGTLEWYTERWGMITMSERVTKLMEGHVHELNKLLKKIRWQKDHADPVTIREEFERESRLGDNVNSLSWGRQHESESVEQYELTRNVTVFRPGFFQHPLWPTLCGSSIDFIENDTFACEIKCPYNSENHLRTIRFGMDPMYFNQTQGHMEVTGLEKGKFISYDPRHPIDEQKLYVQNLERDLEWTLKFRKRMEEFAHHMEAGTQFEQQMGKATDGIPSMF
jgi:hypothetical protein